MTTQEQLQEARARLGTLASQYAAIEDEAAADRRSYEARQQKRESELTALLRERLRQEGAVAALEERLTHEGEQEEGDDGDR